MCPQTDNHKSRLVFGSNQFIEDLFLSPKAYPTNMDRYLIRKAVLRALQGQMENLQGTILDVGCGQSPYKDMLLSGDSGGVHRYIGLDREENPIHDNHPDLCWEGDTIPLDEASVDNALCTEVLEHCPEPAKVLGEVQRVLKPGGLLFFTTPFLWPLHEIPYDEYRFTPFALQRLLSDAGFEEVEIVPLGGWDASLAQMLGLWARRRQRGRFGRSFWSCVLYPFYIALICSDKRHKWEFNTGPMFTGVSGTGRKPRANQNEN